MENTTNNLALKWTSEGESDLAHIIDYIGERNPNAAHKFLDIIEEKTGNIRRNPQMYRTGRVEGTREMLISPSYVLVYEETETEVRVLRVLHTAQMWPE